MSWLLGWLDPYKWLAIGAVLVIAAGVFFWQRHEIDGLEHSLEAEKTGRLADRAQAAEAAAAAVAAYRAREQAWAKQHEEIVNVAIQKTEAAASAVVAADAASRSLRGRVAALTAAGRRASCDPAAAGAGKAASDPIGMLADVFDRADKRAGVVAAYADRARIAGEACQASYEALRK